MPLHRISRFMGAVAAYTIPTALRQIDAALHALRRVVGRQPTILPLKPSSIQSRFLTKVVFPRP
ncbi:MAG: hypothetical protein AAB403_12915, partial [Planctomycetota bacterium]